MVLRHMRSTRPVFLLRASIRSVPVLSSGRLVRCVRMAYDVGRDDNVLLPYSAFACAARGYFFRASMQDTGKASAVHVDSDRTATDSGAGAEELCASKMTSEAGTNIFSGANFVKTNAEASACFADGRFNEAIALWHRVLVAIDKSTSASQEGNIAKISCLNNLACSYGEIGNYKRKLSLLEQSLSLVEAVYGTRHPQYGILLYNVASALEETGRYDEMVQRLQQSLSIHEERFHAQHPKVGRVLLLLSVALGHTGDLTAQLRTAQRAYEIVRKHCGPQHIQTSLAMLTLAQAHGRSGNFTQQLQLALGAASLQEQKLGSMNAQLAQTYMQLASAYGNNKDHFNQKVYLERSVEIQKRSFGTQHMMLVDAYIALGDVHGLTDEEDVQAQYYLDALHVARQRFDGAHIALCNAVTKAALGHLLLGQLSRAEALLREAHDIVPRAVTPNHLLVKELDRVAALVKMATQSSDKRDTSSKC